MKHRDVILDFTSLLDVILIILFFFVLYSVFDADQAIAEADSARAEYVRESARLEEEYAEKTRELLAEQEAAREELEAEWNRLLADGDAAAKNMRALDLFGSGGMLTFRLQKTDASPLWQLYALRGEERVAEISPEEELRERIGQILSEAFPEGDEVILATLIYDGDVLGTNRICAMILDAFGAVGEERGNLYLNTVNISK